MDSPTPHTPGSHAGERAVRARRTEKILGLIAETAPDEREPLFERLVEVNMPVAFSVAARYKHRGVPVEDLEQVASLALVRVARTFDATRGHDFLSYAVPSMRGEVRRYFRDHGWMVRPPRGIQEMQGRIAATESQLASRLGHPASTSELADDLSASVAEVEEALNATGCFNPTSLDQVPDVDRSTLGDRLGADDPGLAAAEARVVLRPLLRGLTPRERTILEMRFFRQQSQQEIGDAIGVTQMQVSRLLGDLLERIRGQAVSAAVSTG